MCDAPLFRHGPLPLKALALRLTFAAVGSCDEYGLLSIAASLHIVAFSVSIRPTLRHSLWSQLRQNSATILEVQDSSLHG